MRRPGSRTKIAAVSSVAVGALLVLAPLAGDGVGRAAAGERLVDQARPSVGRTGIVQLRTDTDLVIETGGAILNEALPLLGEALGLDAAGLDRFVADLAPHLAEADERKVELGTALDATVSNLEAHAADFRAADAIPVGGAHHLLLPIGAMIAGLALIGAGLVALRGRGTGAIVALGAALALGPLVVGMPQKVAAAESLLGSLTTTQEQATRTREQFELTVTAADELRRVLLPRAAELLGTSPEELMAGLVVAVPDLAGVDALDDALARIEADVRFREERLDDFAAVQDVPFAAITWFVIAAGALLGVVALGAERHPRVVAAA